MLKLGQRSVPVNVYEHNLSPHLLNFKSAQRFGQLTWLKHWLPLSDCYLIDYVEINQVTPLVK